LQQSRACAGNPTRCLSVGSRFSVARYEQEFAALTFSGYTQGKQAVLFLVIAKPNSSIRVFPTTLIWVNDR
jgi:hypothetical protein